MIKQNNKEGGFSMSQTVSGRKILFVEDDEAIRLDQAKYFRMRGNMVYEANCLNQAIKLINSVPFDAIILDIVLPDGEGLDLFSLNCQLPPTIILSDLGSDCDILEGFSVGALDYIVKPCSPEVLEARLSLRLIPKENAILSLHNLTVDTIRRTVSYNNVSITLTSSEFNILVFLMKNAGIFFNAEEIYEKVWQMPSLKSTTIRYHISNLRQKLIKFTDKNLIITEFGKGYAFLAGK